MLRDMRSSNIWTAGYDVDYGIASGRLGFPTDPAGAVSCGHSREGTACGWVDKRRYRAFRQLGLSHGKARQFCYSRLGGWNERTFRRKNASGILVREPKAHLSEGQLQSHYG